MDSSHSSARSSVSHNSVSSDVVVESFVPSGTVLNAFTEEIVAYENDSNETHAVKIKGNVYDSVDDCVVAYMKYVAEAGFVVRRSCQKRMLNADVKQKKFVLNVFDTIHNHELEREEYKHLSKTERQLTYMEQVFIVKAASVNIGATRAHHLLTGIKGFVFACSREFGDVASFDATFKTNKFFSRYKMVFVPFTAIENHRKCVTVVAGLLKNETTKSYIWLLKAFMKAFGKAPSIVVINQDGAMRNVIEAEFGGSKHRLCMWHITQKLPAKELSIDGVGEKLMEEFNLENHKWLTKMFNIHSTWIPAYFIDSPLCGLMRMTSRRRWRRRKAGTRKDGFKTIGLLFPKNANVEMIPQQYILRHWTKNLIPAALRNKRNKYGEKNVVVENYANEETSIVDHCVHLLSKDEPRLGAFVEKLKSLKKEVEADCLNPPSKKKTDNLEQLVGVPKPPVVDDRNSCSLCGGTDHNKRTCPRRFEGQDEVVVQKEVGQEEVLVQKEVCQEEVLVQKEVCQEEVVVQEEVCQKEVVQENIDLSEDEEELSEEYEDLIHK
ncbi:protein FAR1-related sequence 5 [Tanacetum coccineum]|uniref:Protein FAR1-related sequence 5 n=1 Tax=Tanacetum coccineum TaxID=301880 RepID=A0ABQ5D1H6_9ASTR